MAFWASSRVLGYSFAFFGVQVRFLGLGLELPGSGFGHTGLGLVFFCFPAPGGGTTVMHCFVLPSLGMRALGLGFRGLGFRVRLRFLPCRVASEELEKGQWSAKTNP